MQYLILLTVRLGKDGSSLGSIESNRELSHWVHILRETVEERNHMLRQNRATLMELFGEGIHLLLCGDLGSH